MPAERLLVFVKRPRAGEVKTRLAQDIGADDAAAVYQAMAEHVLAATACPGGRYEREIWFAPAAAADDVAGWLPGETVVPQTEGDLGQRMDHAFRSAFAQGAQRVVLIGTDAPAVDGTRVEEALDALQERDVVLGPARDGGYYLIGLAAPRPALFADIAWSTPSVYAATLDRARALGLRTAALPELRDVDTLDDLRHEWKRLAPLFEGREALRERFEPGR